MLPGIYCLRKAGVTMAYKRLISYFDLIENELKRGNAGFVKWEQYDECHILSVFVSGLDGTFNKETKVYLDESVLGTLSIRGGRGEGTYLLTGEDKERGEYIEEIRIILDDHRMLVAEFESSEKPQDQENMRSQESEPVQEPVQQVPVEKVPEEEEEKERTAPEKEWEESETDSSLDEAASKSLWDTLGKTHEPFSPFDNEVECFRIFPKDLNLLQADYRPFQSNQFLMHGYYNYRHLILFRKKDEPKEYWLGVPGIYHEREKMAARMFGFEKFEAANKEYRTGDLGYYLVTVK